MRLENLYERICLASEDDDAFEMLIDNSSVIWGNSYDVIDAAKKIIDNLHHQYTEYPDSSRLESVLSIGDNRIKISADSKKGDNQELIVALNTLLNDYEILFVSKSNGNSDLAFIIDKKHDTEHAKNKYGFEFKSNFVPISSLPDLWNTPGRQIDIAIEEYANSNL